MRSDPLAANLFHGGRAEKIFQQQLDQVLSDRIANGRQVLTLVDTVASYFAGQPTGSSGEVDLLDAGKLA